jgi:ubiquinone/menaquinone biosynthesis C-methylase UbiE
MSHRRPLAVEEHDAIASQEVIVRAAIGRGEGPIAARPVESVEYVGKLGFEARRNGYRAMSKKEGPAKRSGVRESETVYDRHAQFFLDFTDRSLAGSGGVVLVLSNLIASLGERLQGARVCDLCCGEGYVGRSLIDAGAREVVGVDLSSTLIEAARRRARSPRLSYVVDDAQSLRSFPDGAFDFVVCQMAVPDVADHPSLLAAVRRVIAPGGPFVFSVLHPCFEAPFHVPDAPPYLLDDDARPLGRVVRRYASEGLWNSGGDGMRGRMGAYHRKVSTYVNDLLAGGFALERLDELLADHSNESTAGISAEIPVYLAVAAHAA